MEFGDTEMYKVSKEAQRMQSEVKLSSSFFFFFFSFSSFLFFFFLQHVQLYCPSPPCRESTGGTMRSRLKVNP